MTDREKLITAIERAREQSEEFGIGFIVVKFKETDLILKLLKEQQETIASLQGTICKLNAALAERPEQKFFVDSDGKMTPLPVQKHGHWISYGCGFYRCSVCDDRKNMNFVPNYCSTCGAKMDEKMDNLEVKQNG